MKLIKPSYEIWEQGKELSGVAAQIERAARVCYASEPKGEVGELLGKLIKSKHYAMLEHGTVYLYIPSFEGDFYQHEDGSIDMPRDVRKYYTNKYSKFNYEDSIQESGFYITTNYRVLVENNWLDDLKYLCEPTEYHEKRITVKFIMDRIGSQSFCRHRVFSFAQESTRYCNYSKDKFGNEVTFIQPCWDYIKTAAYNGVDHFDGDYFEHSLREAESYYFKLLDLGWKPQQARQVLPNALKTELVMTGFVSDWKHLFRLRTSFIAETGKPHPDIANLCDPLYNRFKELNLI
jgi:thymidylate synthase (FAD)